MRTPWALAVAISFAALPLAHAEDPEVYVEVKAPAKPGGPPQLVATIIHGPQAKLAELSITTAAPDALVSIKATKVTPYAAGDQPIALAVVVLGQEVWMGNDDLTKADDPARYPGVLKALAKALDASKLAAVGPKGSQAAIISYGTGAAVRLPLGDLAKLRGAALGSQQTYAHAIGEDLVAGVTLAIAELSKATTARRAIIVIGDGNDTNNDAAKAQLLALKKQALSQGTELFAIVYRSAVSPEGEIVSRFARTTTVASTANLAAALTAIAIRLGQRYYVTFPAVDAATHQALPWDGKPHDLTIVAAGVKLPSAGVTLMPLARP